MNKDTALPEKTETILTEFDPLRLDISDAKLVSAIDDRIENSIKTFERFKVYDRQKKNEKYFLGNQVDERNLHPSSMPYVENVVFEAIMRNKPIALSRLPDLMVTAAKDTPESEKMAEVLTDLVNSDIRKRENRNVLGLAYKQRPIYFYSVIKARWNPEKNDYEFIVVKPDNIILDAECPTPNADDMSFVTELKEVTVKELIMMFPKKKEEIFSALGFEDNDRGNEKKLASKVKVSETWFDYYDETTDSITGESKWEKISGVVWKYKQLVLHKMKNPYWDWEGDNKAFNPEVKEVEEATEDEVIERMFGGTDAIKVFNNYLSQPSKPYFIMTYHRMGDLPIDSTSEIEQVLKFQDSINLMGRHIQDMNVRSRGKLAFSTEYLKSEYIDEYDPNDPDQHIKVKAEDVRRAVAHLSSPPAPAQMYNSKQEHRSIAFEMLAMNATTRGTREPGDETLGAKQMMREQDFGVIDDMVEETINPAAEWMARWAMQFIKLFYTAGKMRRMVGQDGEGVYVMMSQDMVDDGQEVLVGASGVDKQNRKRQAVMDASMGLSDPLTYFESLGVHNAKEKARRVMLYNLSPQMYFQEYIEGRDLQEQVAAVAPPVAPPQGAPAAPPQGAPPQGGGSPMSGSVQGHTMQNFMGGGNNFNNNSKKMMKQEGYR